MGTGRAGPRRRALAAMSRLVRVTDAASAAQVDDDGVEPVLDLDAVDRPSVTLFPGGAVIDAWDPPAGPDWPPSSTVRVLVEPPGQADSGALRVEVVVDGWRFEFEVEDARRAELRGQATRTAATGTASGPIDIRAIIAGRVAAVRVVAGDRVEAGQSLLVVEAMKMQNELRAPRAGTVERVAVEEGQTIDNGDLLVVLR